jgi:nitroimidazol reductase NimA-like FMN-containing flavoprotein (pyridoxamine 5'-phosphate oxidase superfamily)
MGDELKSSRTELERYPARGHHDFATIAAILDEAFVCHVGFEANGQPYVLPTIYGRDDRTIYLHGAASGRLLNALASADAICITVTLVDGLVLARSGLHSSVNYRSVVMLGTAEAVNESEREKALKVVLDHVVPGRWEALRPINGEGTHWPSHRRRRGLCVTDLGRNVGLSGNRTGGRSGSTA